MSIYVYPGGHCLLCHISYKNTHEDHVKICLKRDTKATFCSKSNPECLQYGVDETNEKMKPWIK